MKSKCPIPCLVKIKIKYEYSLLADKPLPEKDVA